MRRNSIQYNPIQYLNLWANDNSTYFLKQFFSSIFIASIGKARKCDSDSVLSNLSEAIEEEKKSIQHNRKLIEALFRMLKNISEDIILNPENFSSSLMHQEIKNKLHIRKKRKWNITIDEFITEASVSAMNRIYEFVVLLENDMDKWESPRTKSMIEISLNDVPDDRAYSLSEKQIQAILIEVCCEETEAYIIHHLEHSSISKNVDENKKVEKKAEPTLWQQMSGKERALMISVCIFCVLLLPVSALLAALLFNSFTQKLRKEKEMKASCGKMSLFVCKKEASAPQDISGDSGSSASLTGLSDDEDMLKNSQ